MFIIDSYWQSTRCFASSPRPGRPVSLVSQDRSDLLLVFSKDLLVKVLLSALREFCVARELCFVCLRSVRVSSGKHNQSRLFVPVHGLTGVKLICSNQNSRLGS